MVLTSISEDDFFCGCGPKGRVSQPVFGESNIFLCKIRDSLTTVTLRGKVKTNGLIFGEGLVNHTAFLFKCNVAPLN